MSLSVELTALKAALETYGKTIDLEIIHDLHTYRSENIVSCNVSFEGSLLTAIMKQAEIEVDGVGGPDFAESMKGQRLNINLTVTGEETAKKEYGTFIVKDAEYKDDTNSVILTCYDLLLPAMTPYTAVIDFTPIEGYDITGNDPSYVSAPAMTAGRYTITAADDTQDTAYLWVTATGPDGAACNFIFGYSSYSAEIINALQTGNYLDINGAFNEGTYEFTAEEFIITLAEPIRVTLGKYLQAICDHLGITLATPTFTNSEVPIDEEKYNADYTIRDVLTEIAQAAAGTIAIKDDELYVLYPTATEKKVEPSNLKAIEIGELYGPVNSVVLSRNPQEDNIYKRDEAAEKICEIKIENNQLMDSHREDFIEGIYNALYGLTYYPHEVESFGIGILDICDLFTIETLDGNTYTALHLTGSMEITQGLIETTKGTAPAATETDYKAASKTDRVINKTILRVDKQEQEIQALVTTTTNQKNELTGQIENLTKTVEQKITADDVQILISKTVEGITSITTTKGYTFSDDGLHIKDSGAEMENTIDHTGMYVDRDEDNILTANHEGVDAINLRARQFFIIGDNSRLENYEKKRTACFYIGG